MSRRPTMQYRWALCTRALGREPSTMEYMAWINARIAEFEGRGGTVLPLCHTAFDEYLREFVRLVVGESRRLRAKAARRAS